MTTSQQIQFTSCDGASNVISVLEANTGDTIILCVPAMGVGAKQYTGLLKELVNHGVSAASVDLRGNGQSSVRASRANNFGYAELAEIDLPAAVLAIKQHFPAYKLVLLGHSLGGQACALFLSQNPSATDDLILAASCSVYYRNWSSPYRWSLLSFSQAAWLISVIVGYFPGRRLGFGGTEARGLMRDWAHNARTGDYQLLNSKYSYVPFPKLPNLNILAINFTDDQLAPVEATEHLLSKLSSNYVSKLTLSGSDIGRRSASHFNWLRSPKQVAKIVVEHLNRAEHK